MDINDVYIVGEKDVDLFNRYEYILEQLTDIYKKRDMRDERVLAYCQPVFNIKTGRYDTAEALMRLKLNNIGMVYPDKFIPLAEEKGYIHVLTEIILQKTCDEIRPGYHHVESCQETVPEAFTAFFEGKDFEDSIRNAVSLGGDCDTLTCITGGLAEAFFGVPDEFIRECNERIPDEFIEVIEKFFKATHGR